MQSSNSRNSGSSTRTRTIATRTIIATLIAGGITVSATHNADAAPIKQAPEAVVLAIQAAFPPEAVSAALAVSHCESNWLINERTAGARRRNVGLFQINRVHQKRVAKMGYTWDQVRLDPQINSVVAASIWADQGWRPWSCRRVLR
jgi:hypothetical protein